MFELMPTDKYKYNEHIQQKKKKKEKTMPVVDTAFERNLVN